MKITDWKKEIKLSFFTGYIIIYIENPKKNQQNLLELIRDYRKFAVYRIDIKVSCFPIYQQ